MTAGLRPNRSMIVPQPGATAIHVVCEMTNMIPSHVLGAPTVSGLVTYGAKKGAETLMEKSTRPVITEKLRKLRSRTGAKKSGVIAAGDGCRCAGSGMNTCRRMSAMPPTPATRKTTA